MTMFKEKMVTGDDVIMVDNLRIILTLDGRMI